MSLQKFKTIWPNLLMAVTNITAVLPIRLAFINGDYLTASLILFTAFASVTSHLWENFKHGMNSITPISQELSLNLNRLDRFACSLTTIRLLYLFIEKHGYNFRILLDHPFMFSPFIFEQISEYDKYNPRLRNIYLVTHSIWHLTIFPAMDFFMSTFIY